MSNPVARVGDVSTLQNVALTGSPNVKVNGKPWHRVGDTWSPGNSPCNGLGIVLATGSSTVKVNGRFAGAVTKLLSCPAAVATGSPNVRVGG